MCEPTTIALLAMGGKGVLDAKAAQDQAAADEATFVTKRDLEIAQAADARQRGAQKEGVTRMTGSRTVADTRAAVAQSPVELSGTVADVLGEQRMFSELDAATIRWNAAREAWGHEAQASIYEKARKAAKSQGELAMLGSFLGTAANLGSIGAKRKS